MSAFNLQSQTYSANDGTHPLGKPAKGSGSAERKARNPAPEKPKPEPRKHIPRNVDREVYRRADGKCERCGKGPKDKDKRGSGVKLEIHHLTPHSRGGADDFDNYALLCRDCNGALGASMPEPKREKPREQIPTERIVSQLAEIVGKKRKVGA